MKTAFRPLVLILALLAATSAEAQSASGAARPAAPAEHVIIIGVDGMSPDGVEKADTPTMRAMMKQGSWSLRARGVMPTTSAANWASMITGAGPEQHGVTSNDWKVGEFNFPTAVIGTGGFFPSIFQVLREQNPTWEIGSIYHWDGFGNLYDHRFVSYDRRAETEDETTDLAVRYIQDKRPKFLFVHLDHVDHAGHAYGHGSPKYYDSVAKADRLIEKIRQATVAAGIADKTVILISSDHGGVGKGHGGETLAELEIPWIAYGAPVQPGRQLNLPINTFDTPATAAWLLGAQPPYAWIGRPVTPIGKGAPMPPQTYMISGFHAAPVIEPAGDGNTPPGGLFVDRNARLTLRNPNPVGEIRYTLDGSTPTAASPRYDGPVEITRNTIVRAALFVDGKAASATATGYFRIVRQDAAQPRGVAYKTYLLPEPAVRLPDFSRLQPASSGVTLDIALAGVPLPREDNVAVVFEGDLRIDTAGTYRFALASDDGSKLYVDGKAVVDNDGDHGVITAKGEITLQPGRHALRVEYFNGGGGSWLGAYFEGPGLPRQFIDPNLLTPAAR